MRILPFLCATTALAMPVAAYAQQITSEIQGTVTDASGAPVAGATVEVTDTRTGATRTITTGDTGTFSASGLVTGGPYTVTATAAGLQGQTVNDITTSLEGATRLTFSLEAGDEAAIVVTGTRVRLTQLEVGPGTSFGQDVLQAAPTFNRDIRDVIRFDPRVSLDRDDTGGGFDRISCLGGNDRGNLFTVDGLTQGDVYGLNGTGFSARSATPLPFDAIRETQVQFAPFDVEYGQFTGCAINVVTRSGTNRLTGSAFFEYSNSDMRANEVAGLTVGEVAPQKRWGATLGGPVIKDRLFLFGAYEHFETAENWDFGPTGADPAFASPLPQVTAAQFNQVSEILSRVYGIETGPLARSLDNESDRYFVRADLQITDDHRLEATYQRLEEAEIRKDDFFETGSSPTVTGLNNFLTSGTKSNYYSGRLYSNWTDRLSTELRYARAEVQDLQDPIGGGEAQSGNPITRIVVGIDNPGNGDATIIAGPGNSRSANDLQTKVEQYRALLNYDAGDHTLKLGFELNRADVFNLFVQNATGTLAFESIADLEAGLLSRGLANTGARCTPTTSNLPANLVAGCSYGATGNFTPTGDITEAGAKFKRDLYSVYAQDDWQINDKTLIVAGIRADWLKGGAPRLNPNFVERYGFGNDVGFSDFDPVLLPRLAVTYDFDDAGIFTRSQIRGGVGIFSGGDPLVWVANAFQNNGYGFALGSSTTANCGTARIDVVTNGQFTGVPGCISTAAQTSAGRGLGFVQSVNPDIKMPTVARINVGYQTRLDFQPSGFFSGWDFSADYIYSRYNNPVSIVDLSQIPDFRTALGGYTVDGRPIYANIDPTRTGCDAELVGVNPAPAYRNVTAACFGTARFDELQLVNTQGYRSHNLSFLLSKRFDQGVITPGGNVFFSLGYAFTDSQDRRNMYSSTAGSNYDDVAAFDRQNPAASRGFYETRHNIALNTSFTEEFFSDLDTRFSISFVARSGRPFSLTFAGNNRFNPESGSNNALAYIPTGISDPNLSPQSDAAAVADYVTFLNTIDCDDEYRGRTIKRNTCTNDWSLDMDLMLSQEIPGPGRLFGVRDRLRAYVMVDNFLNLLDSGWNVFRRRDYRGTQEIITLNGIDPQGRYIIGPVAANTLPGDRYDADEFVNISSSAWRVKVGVSYEF